MFFRVQKKIIKLAAMDINKHFNYFKNNFNLNFINFLL